MYKNLLGTREKKRLFYILFLLINLQVKLKKLFEDGDDIKTCGRKPRGLDAKRSWEPHSRWRLAPKEVLKYKSIFIDLVLRIELNCHKDTPRQSSG